MEQTVIQYVLSRLHALGVTEVFGVPGDYAFPVNDAVCTDPRFCWIGTCNELGAAYAADGYARVKGFAALSTTYGVGELSAIGGIAGAYAEHLPIFHLVCMPPMTTQHAHLPVHHTLGNGAFDLFYQMTEPVICARAILTPQNVVAETERLIAAALFHRRPVYLAFPEDHAHAPIHESMVQKTSSQSDPVALEAAVSSIVEVLTKARTACILPGMLITRLGQRAEALAVLDASGLPFATMLMDKSVFDETHPAYIGMYDGQLMNPEVRAFVESCDVVLNLGALFTDISSGAFTARIESSKRIDVLHHRVQVGSSVFQHVEMKDMLPALVGCLPTKTERNGPQVAGLGEPQGNGDESITAAYLYPRWGQFLQPEDILVTETGTVSMGLAFAHLPAGAAFHNQTLWGSIGWATPAAFGVALADPTRRTVLITREGSHQLTAQEISHFPRHGLKPIIFVLNNGGYLTERLFCEDPQSLYNTLAPWNYHQLPEAFGCMDWLTARVTTCGELDQAMIRAQTCSTGAYIEVVTDTYTVPPLPLKMDQWVKAMARERT